MEKYRDWDILESLPDGWVIDKTAGSPYPRSVFITNGKSPLNGQKRAILKLKNSDLEKQTTSNKALTVKQNLTVENNNIEKTEIPIFPAKTVNILSRKKNKGNNIKQQSLFDTLP